MIAAPITARLITMAIIFPRRPSRAPVQNTRKDSAIPIAPSNIAIIDLVTTPSRPSTAKTMMTIMTFILPPIPLLSYSAQPGNSSSCTLKISKNPPCNASILVPSSALLLSATEGLRTHIPPCSASFSSQLDSLSRLKLWFLKSTVVKRKSYRSVSSASTNRTPLFRSSATGE